MYSKSRHLVLLTLSAAVAIVAGCDSTRSLQPVTKHPLAIPRHDGLEDTLNCRSGYTMVGGKVVCD